MAEKTDENFYIALSNKIVTFDPVDQVTNVFFDDSNKQVFTVRSEGALVVVKGLDNQNIKFSMEGKGEVIYIKFSADMKILAIQRSKTSVEFMLFDGKLDTREFSQSCKGKSTEILGFSWTNINEIVFITDYGIELYQVFPEKRTLKMVKNVALSVNWYSWHAESGMLLLSSGVLGNIVHPFQFRPGGSMTKFPKFELELPSLQRSSMKLRLFARDVTVADLYGDIYVIVVRCQSKTQTSSYGSEIALYKILKDSPSRKIDVLRVDMNGRYAVNILDNLIVVHHQASKTSLLFDIHVGGKLDNGVINHHPVVPPLPIKPYRLSGSNSGSAEAESKLEEYELYSQNWIVFQPNIIIDARLGCLWRLHLRLSPLPSMMPDKVSLVELLLNRQDSKSVLLGVCRQLLHLRQPAHLATVATLFDRLNAVYVVSLVELLLNRQDSKSVLLDVCRQLLHPRQPGHLATVATVFDRLNAVYFEYLQFEMSRLATESPQKTTVSQRPGALLDQADLYTNVFSAFEGVKDVNYKFLVSVLVEYIRSLNQHGIAVQHYLYELIINCLVLHNRFYQLHQFLQYHVLTDSKPLACLMLSLEATYPPAHQLALDMLKRLQTADEEILEVLLSKQQIVTALRFAKSVAKVDQISARKYLEVARATGDKDVFFSVFRFFEQRNARLRGSARFEPGDQCDTYVQHFTTLFAT